MEVRVGSFSKVQPSIFPNSCSARVGGSAERIPDAESDLRVATSPIRSAGKGPFGFGW